MELDARKPSPLRFCGPDSIMVLYMDPLGDRCIMLQDTLYLNALDFNPFNTAARPYRIFCILRGGFRAKNVTSPSEP